MSVRNTICPMWSSRCRSRLFAAEFAAAGEVALSWSPAMDPLEATAAPTGYVVYTRVDDGGFDNGLRSINPV